MRDFRSPKFKRLVFVLINGYDNAMSKTKPKNVRKPRLLITTKDREILASMIGHAPTSAAAMLLEHELDRAVVVNEAFDARPFCRIGSWVTYEDHGSGQTREIQIVLPADADIDKRCVSVLSLVGAALLGLTISAEFEWSDDRGRPHRLTVLNVTNEQDSLAG